MEKLVANGVFNLIYSFDFKEKQTELQEIMLQG